ncbi:DUF2634 domain-containing protein [Filifactor villosus]|uniref:DUF2634 domain-containing protein n=1 Tax=Filifactor villosus TaxID=29374 RepID=A0ABV9QNI9_9FIRM
MKLLPEQIEYTSQEDLQRQKSDKVHHIQTNQKLSSATIDSLSAVKQATFCILATEQGAHEIYTPNYGLRTLDLYGEAFGYVVSELSRRIKESLVKDERITDVFDFEFEQADKDAIRVLFKVETIHGVISESYTASIIKEGKE